MGARGPAGGGLGPSRAACAASPGGFANFPASLSLRHGKGWSVTERPAGSGTERPRCSGAGARLPPSGAGREAGVRGSAPPPLPALPGALPRAERGPGAVLPRGAAPGWSGARPAPVRPAAVPEPRRGPRGAAAGERRPQQQPWSGGLAAHVARPACDPRSCCGEPSPAWALAAGRLRPRRGTALGPAGGLGAGQCVRCGAGLPWAPLALLVFFLPPPCRRDVAPPSLLAAPPPRSEGIAKRLGWDHLKVVFLFSFLPGLLPVPPLAILPETQLGG